MPTKKVETGQFYYEIDGELKLLEMGASIEDCAEIVSDVENALSNPEYFKGGEVTFKMKPKEYKCWKKIMRSVMPRYFTNNWRKMHHLPMVRRGGKRK